MNITCDNCTQVLSEYLCDIPSSWRDQIVKAVCSSISKKSETDCEDVKACETRTSLSSFTREGTTVCITYEDEKGVSVNRCFEFDSLLNSTLDSVDPKCIASQEDWDSWTYTERVQAIIDYMCNCCS